MNTLKERIVSYSSHVHNKLKVCLKKVESLGRIWAIESGLRELLRKIVHVSLSLQNSQSEVSEPAASASFGNSLECTSSKPGPRPTESEHLF